jgi:adenylylsulfate kinase
MVYWITGKASSGKTLYARRLKEQFEKLGEKVLLLDGDEVRQYFETGYTDEERREHILRIAAFASIAEDQGFLVIVALVSPKKEWRMDARKMFKHSMLIYVPGGCLWSGTTYEEPDHEEIISG